MTTSQDTPSARGTHAPAKIEETALPMDTIHERPRTGGNDAVCFTSGLKGASFGAGVIHAWLASDRQPPRVAAGISMGATSSAAMQQCYRELEGADPGSLEPKRWAWFRRYLESVTNGPLGFVWRAIPDPVDFFAESTPVNDLSTENLPFNLPKEAERARWHFYLLTKLGVWLAGLPVRIGTLASIAVYWVRCKERYGFKLLNPVLLVWNALKALAAVWWHTLRSPRFLNQRSFRRGLCRPLFGWGVWCGSTAPVLAAAILIVASQMKPVFKAVIELEALLIVLVLVFAAYLGLQTHRRQKWSIKRVLMNMGRPLFDALDINLALLSQFEFKRGLAELFDTQMLDPALTKNGPEMHLLIVCAALQQRQQIWPAATDFSVVDALVAANAVPGVFPPIPTETRRLGNYVGNEKTADVIDGAAVRHNPIPAFFAWCNQTDDVARELEQSAVPNLHVIYNVPIDVDGSVADAPGKQSIDIVDSALSSLELAKRRDTRQEVRQTNFLSELERIRRRASRGDTAKHAAFQIFADEIAPREEIKFNNEWSPSRDESLKFAANGCRAALETLYRRELQEQTGGAGSVPCVELLRTIAHRRVACLGPDTPGLPEICAQCTRSLDYRPRMEENAPTPGVIQSYGEKGSANLEELPAGFENLQGDLEPRIVFLGNGGVFRGAFHIGVIGAMQATRVFPHLVVGASVGALMGGALAAISVAPENRETELLTQLANVFLNVDQRVALTRTLKNATKQLGVRARDLRIAPSELKRMVLRGSQADAGYAATGAPPALIDALSQLFTIPYRRTTEIASAFVAGHFTAAIAGFLKEVRRETLSSFEIENFLIGISLLKEEAENLLGGTLPGVVRLDKVQPYHYPAKATNGKKVSFFCTTSLLNARTSLLLGRDFLTKDPTWDFIFAALSSSAFPAVFSPRSEAEVVPGLGRTDRLFSDGGMFDNLPFFPAIEILNAGQTSWRTGNKDIGSVLKRVQQRTKGRDIIIAAGLDAAPGKVTAYDTLFKIKNRAASLSVESKVRTFIHGANAVKDALEQIALMPASSFDPQDAPFLDSAVNAAVLNILPTDKDHINPTFAFCRSMGLDVKVVQTSIADGCFRTLAAFVDTYANDTTVREAFGKTTVPALAAAVQQQPQPNCPYFRLVPSLDSSRKPGPLTCPFAAATDPGVSDIRNVCAKDKAHRGQWRDSQKNAVSQNAAGGPS